MNPRILEFIVGIETSPQPDAGTPTDPNDIVTKDYVDSLSGFTVEGDHATPYSTVAGTSIPFAVGTIKVKKYIKGTGGVTISANPRVQAGTIEGQELMLVGTSDTDTVTLADANGLQLNGPMIFIDGSILVLNWDDDQSLWIEKSRNNL